MHFDCVNFEQKKKGVNQLPILSHAHVYHYHITNKNPAYQNQLGSHHQRPKIWPPTHPNEMGLVEKIVNLSLTC